MIAKEHFIMINQISHNVQLPFEFSAFIESKLAAKYNYKKDEQYNEDDDMVLVFKDMIMVKIWSIMYGILKYMIWKIWSIVMMVNI